MQKNKSAVVVECPSCEEKVDRLLFCGECSECCGCDKCEGCKKHLSKRPGSDLNECVSCGNCQLCCDCRMCYHRNKKSANEEFCDQCDSCKKCCTCVKCPRCHEKNYREDICDTCNRCTNNCCQCFHCGACDHAFENDDVECEGCGYCRDCCECEDTHENYGNVWTADDLKDRKIFNCKRLAGVEWEYNQLNGEAGLLKTWEKKWRAGNHRDGSCGREVVTAPIAGDHISKCLLSLGDVFTKSKAKIDTTCGLHVHVDASDYDWTDMYRLLALYTKVEPVLYMLAGQYRSQNHYCQPCGADFIKALNNKDKMTGVLNMYYPYVTKTAFSDRYTAIGKKDGGRYRGLNLCPWMAGIRTKKKDTTVEFRLHRNTSDAKRVVAWTQLCVTLVEWAKTHTMKDIAKLPKSALRSLCTVSPQSTPWVVERMKEFRRATSKKSRVKRYVHLVKGEYKLTPYNSRQDGIEVANNKS